VYAKIKRASKYLRVLVHDINQAIEAGIDEDDGDALSAWRRWRQARQTTATYHQWARKFDQSLRDDLPW
jgi:hypothetical protein